MKDKILIVEDDHYINDLVKSFLSNDYSFDSAFDGEEGYELIKNNDYVLIILDIMIPKLNGIDLLRKLRETSHTPVLILSAKDTDVDKAMALGFGADDYLQKPFSLIELQARVRAIIRRSQLYKPIPKQVVEINGLSMDVEAYLVKKNGEPIKLTSTEFEILKLFMLNPTRVYTKAQLYYQVWGEEYLNDDNVINVQIKRLREKIEDNPSKPKYIVTLWGIGYKMGE